MKIAMINTVYKNGGSTGRIVYDLANSTRKCGSRALVLFGYEYIPTSDNDTYKIETIPQLKTSILKTRLFARHGFYNKSETKKMLNVLDDFEPDIIHLHNLHGHYLNIDILFDYIRRKNIPVVWTFHDCWPFTGWGAYFDCAYDDEMPGYKMSGLKNEYPKTWFSTRSRKNYLDKKKTFSGVQNLTIVTPSKWLAELVNESFLKNYDIRVINNGIDLDSFKPTISDFRKNNNLEDVKIVLAVANVFARRKGIDYLLKLPELLNDGYQLVLIGLTENQIKSLPQGCLGLPRTNNLNDLAAAYTAADVFINPTLEDNFPTTNLEALACGTPVITFATGGSPESVGQCGKIVEKGNIEAMKIAIEEVCEKNKISSESCVERAKLLYGKDRFFHKYNDLYNSIV